MKIPSMGSPVSQDLEGIFNIPPSTQDLVKSTVMENELKRLRDMISSVPGVI